MGSDTKRILKTCISCKETYSTQFFGRDKRSADGLRSKCRDCHVTSQTYAKNKRNIYANRETLKGRFSYWKARANYNNKKTEWNLSYEDIRELYINQDGRCFYSGARLEFRSSNDLTISLDRVDSKKGYIPGNIVLCTADINYMKQSLSQERFILLCNFIAKKHNRLVAVK